MTPTAERSAKERDIEIQNFQAPFFLFSNFEKFFFLFFFVFFFFKISQCLFWFGSITLKESTRVYEKNGSRFSLGFSLASSAGDL